jgi:hypothetical protein
MALSSDAFGLDGLGATLQLTASVKDQTGAVMNGATVSWASSAAGVATVSASGLVTAVATGTATITATSGSLSRNAVASVTQNPAKIEKVSGDAQSGTVSQALANPLVVLVTDAKANPISGAAVAFAVTSGGGSVGTAAATTGADGKASSTWTLGSVVGSQVATATVTGLTAAGFTATGTVPPGATTIAINAGNGQTGLVGYAVNVVPSVIVRFASDNTPAVGQSVTFAVTGGSGSVTGGTALTNSSGIATLVSWVLGASAGANTMTATVASAAAGPATFTATGAVKSFHIDVRFSGTPSAALTTAFNNAVAKWETVVYGDLINQAVLLNANDCGANTNPSVNESVDDVIIFARADSIDGPSGILAQAGPCVIRGQTGTNAKLTSIGIMTFDTADAALMNSNGTLNDVVLHEMGHVLGIGTLWPAQLNASVAGFGLLQGAGTGDPYYNGANGLAAFTQLGGNSYTGGNKVPVANVGGAGSINSHWRESVFPTELMSPTIAGPGNPLSILTAGSLLDEGYQVNLAGADPYNQVFSAPPMAATTGGSAVLLNDIWSGPLYTVDPAGRLIRIRR